MSDKMSDKEFIVFLVKMIEVLFKRAKDPWTTWNNFSKPERDKLKQEIDRRGIKLDIYL